jgi:hypothetical protein
MLSTMALATWPASTLYWPFCRSWEMLSIFAWRVEETEPAESETRSLALDKYA